MLGPILVTLGLLLDVFGVALLLAAPRVHRRDGSLSLAGGQDDVSTLRSWWSRLGKFGLSIVATGFGLQILGAWSPHADICWLVAGGAVLLPALFGLPLWAVKQLPSQDD